jgi:hypothetical protein
MLRKIFVNVPENILDTDAAIALRINGATMVASQVPIPANTPGYHQSGTLSIAISFLDEIAFIMTVPNASTGRAQANGYAVFQRITR